MINIAGGPQRGPSHKNKSGDQIGRRLLVFVSLANGHRWLDRRTTPNDAVHAGILARRHVDE